MSRLHPPSAAFVASILGGAALGALVFDHWIGLVAGLLFGFVVAVQCSQLGDRDDD
jgi:hypothetical protein